jgi:hypothetical protein
MNFCCIDFVELCQKQIIRIRYEDYLRDFTLKLPGGGGYQQLLYCFCCGKKFPKDLWKKWNSILKKEYHIEDPWEAKYEGKLPPEFLIDEWWKKRGL